MEQLLQYIVREITGEEPNSITSREENETTIYTIAVKQEHMGTLIGKSGRMINAIRTIARTRGAKENIRVNVELQEEA